MIVLLAGAGPLGESEMALAFWLATALTGAFVAIAVYRVVAWVRSIK